MYRVYSLWCTCQKLRSTLIRVPTIRENQGTLSYGTPDYSGYTLSIRNHWMAEANPWSRCCEGNSLSNERIFMILLPQHFAGWIKRYFWVHFSQENTLKAGLEGNSLVKSTRYLIVIVFQGGIFHPNRPVFNLMIPYRLDTLQLTQDKEKSSVAQCSTGWLKKNFSECKALHVWNKTLVFSV